MYYVMYFIRIRRLIPTTERVKCHYLHGMNRPGPQRVHSEKQSLLTGQPDGQQATARNEWLTLCWTSLNAKQQPLSLHFAAKKYWAATNCHMGWRRRRKRSHRGIASSGNYGTCDYNVAVWQNLYPITRIWLGGRQRQQRMLQNGAEPGHVSDSVRMVADGEVSNESTVNGLPTRR